MTDAHRCIAGSSCCAGSFIDGARLGALTEDADTLCLPCVERVESAVQQLPKDWANLRAALGERAAVNGQRISSTPTPALPISTRKEALMRAIVDMADRAAAVVSDVLNTGQPVTYKGRGHPDHPERGLRGSVAITAPNIPILAGAPKAAALVWAKPRRCPIHAELIGLAETAGADLGPAYVLAGQCDDCNGWGDWGQERELAELSGLDIALKLVELHNQTRAELGLTRLRHKYEMPCPNCGAQVGRDDGTTIVDCKQCQSSWTEREYQFLVGLITRERLDMEILKWLLAESYWRLDKLRSSLDLITSEVDETILDAPGAGRVITDAITDTLTGHKGPTDRVIATDRKSTEERQHNDDTWTWGNESPYQRPKRKPAASRRMVKDPIHPSSLTTLVDIDEDVVLSRDARCHNCNLTPCDCA